MVLFFLIGAGTKSYGQAAGDYVFVQPLVTDSLWATVGNWSTSDGVGNLTAATRIPGATDNVWISSGKRMGTVPATISVNTGCTITVGSSTLTLAAANASIVAGMALRNKTSGINGSNYGIAPGTYVTAVSGTSVTLSQPATSSGSALSFEFYPACKTLNVNGFIRVSAAFAVFGDITVYVGGILTHGADLYCANINNSGTFNGNNNYGSSSKSLYFGYNGAVPGTGDYNLINDGVFGDSQIRVPINGNTAGIKVIYSNQASSVTIKPSTPLITGYAFNIAQLVPTNYIKTTANTNLYIKESMSLLLRSGICLSVDQNDSCLGTTRTCTIDPGVSVYLGNKFHANGGVTTYPQGNFVYNVYGTLDLGTYCTASNSLTAGSANITDFDLCMTSSAGNTGSLTFNLGDGTQANGGTLILGSNIKIIKQRTQTLAININDYSTVNVLGNYGWTMNYQLLNSNVPALYLFPKSFYNLTFSGAKSIIPVLPLIRGTRTYTTSAYGVTNWAASVPGTTTISTSLYNGTSATNLPQGSIVYTGNAYYYVPVVRSTSSYATSGTNPITLAGDTIMNYIAAGQYASATGIANLAVSSVSGNNVTLASAPTPSTAQTNTTVQFLGIQGTTAPTGTSSNAYNPVFDGAQGLIYLGDTSLGTAIITGTNPSAQTKATALVYSNESNRLVISNATAGDMATVYAVSGTKVASTKLTADKTTLSIGSGIYLVKINESVSKVVVR